MNEQKPLDLKSLLHKIHEVRIESPELAEKMMDEFSKQADHLRAIDRMAMEAENRSMMIGHIFGLIGVTAIISGAYTAVQGSQWAGAFIGGGGVIGLVSVFVLGRRKT